MVIIDILFSRSSSLLKHIGRKKPLRILPFSPLWFFNSQKERKSNLLTIDKRKRSRLLVVSFSQSGFGLIRRRTVIVSLEKNRGEDGNCVKSLNWSRIENIHPTYITFIYPRRGSSRYWPMFSTIFLFVERKGWTGSVTRKRKFFSARQYLESETVLILFFPALFPCARLSLAERIPNLLPSWSHRLGRKSDIALNGVFTWVEVRRLDFIGDKPR